MALRFELPLQNKPENMQEPLLTQTWSVAANPAESAVPSLRKTSEEHAALQEGHVGNVQIMYCKDQVYVGDAEFTFEELRAERYFRVLREKSSHLNKVKQDLQLQIEQRQRLLQQRNSTAAPPVFHEETDASGQITKDTCEPAGAVVKSAPFKIYNEQESESNSISKRAVSQEEDMNPGGSDPKQQRVLASKPFSVFDENTEPKKIPSSSNRKSLKLPTLNLRAQKSKAELSTDKDASISRSEEPIVNGHWNKTLCRSPNDTCEFARAAQLASTPFGAVERQKPSDGGLTEDLKNLNRNPPETSKAASSDPASEPKKLSPILEISQEWGSTSFATFSQESCIRGQTLKRLNETEISQISETPETALNESKTENVCSLDVRTRLLDQVDVTSFSNFHRKTGRLPETSGEDDLHLDGEVLFFRSKLGKLKGYSLYSSSAGTVILKVDSSSVPWDFFISSKLTARVLSDEEDGRVQTSCFVYENGSLTLWRTPHGMTIQDLLADPVASQDASLLVVQLLEMVKQLHSCQVVHGNLTPETLYLYDSNILAVDFSNSVDLELQHDVTSAQALPSSQRYIQQGLLMPSASPHQVDLIGVAEIVHMLVFGEPMKVVREHSGWSLTEDSESQHSGPVDPLWKDFFHLILNPGDQSTELVLSDLLNIVRRSS